MEIEPPYVGCYRPVARRARRHEADRQQTLDAIPLVIEQLKKAASQQELIIETGVKDTGVLQKAVDELKKLPYVSSYRLDMDTIHINLKGKVEVSEIVAILAQRGIPVEGVKKSEVTLEEIYAKAVKDVER